MSSKFWCDRCGNEMPYEFDGVTITDGKFAVCIGAALEPPRSAAKAPDLCAFCCFVIANTGHCVASSDEKPDDVQYPYFNYFDALLNIYFGAPLNKKAK